MLARLQAVRFGTFSCSCSCGTASTAVRPGRFRSPRSRGPWLSDLARDPDESYDPSERFAADFARLDAERAPGQREIAESPRGWKE